MAYCITHELNNVAWAGGTLGCVMASCPPPDEFDLDGWEWTMSLPVPDAEEMAQMDESADELWFDLQEDL